MFFMYLCLPTYERGQKLKKIFWRTQKAQFIYSYDSIVHSTHMLLVPYSCGVVLVFWFWREIVFGVTYVLSNLY